MSEAANIGDKVLVVQATDQDEGDFAEIRYEIEEGIFAVFEINETSVSWKLNFVWLEILFLVCIEDIGLVKKLCFLTPNNSSIQINTV